MIPIRPNLTIPTNVTTQPINPPTNIITPPTNITTTAPPPNSIISNITASSSSNKPQNTPSIFTQQTSKQDEVTTIDMSKHPSGIVPVLHNIVCTANLGVKLDLKQIALKARNAEYNPKRFPAVIMRIRDPKTTSLVFASGKLVCTGAKSEDQSKYAARKFARIIQKLGFNAAFKEFKIRNIVASCDVQFPIRLEGLAFAHNLYAQYEPELFPGLIYKMIQPDVVLLIFVSGKIVMTKAKVRQDVYDAFENIYPVLTAYKKQ